MKLQAAEPTRAAIPKGKLPSAQYAARSSFSAPIPYTGAGTFDGATATHFSHDFSGVPVSRATAGDRFDVTAGKKIASAQIHPNSDDPSSDEAFHAVSATGSGTVATTYTPEPSDKSSKIVFIQVMRESLDGTPMKPSLIVPAFAYQDADTTSDFYHVDYVSGESDPYYNGDDPGDFGTQGNATVTPAVAASTTDSPDYPDNLFPAGSSKVLWEFKTAAFSAAGADQGSYYGYSDWRYSKEKGQTASTTVLGTTASAPGSKFESAVALWNSNHGFKMPSGGGSVLGGIIGAGLGALAGAGLGFAIGGPIGAVVGGLVGLVGGAFAGSAATRKPQN